MTVLINASNTSGLTFTSDTSGNVAIQSNGSNVITTAGSNVTVAGALSVVGALTTATKGISPASLPSGTVLQTVVSTYSTQATSTSSSFADVGFSATITPLYSTSNVLVIVHLGGCGKSAADTWLYTKMLKNNADWQGIDNFMVYTGTALFQFVGTSTGCWLDSPATTSAITYKPQFKNNQANGTVYINAGGTSSIILMEIAQ